MGAALPRGVAAVLLAACAFVSSAQAQSLSSAGTIAVPTYESVGLYWTNPGGTAGCEVKFRRAGESAWRQGLPMWYDARDTQCRGSLVHLDSNTTYEVQMNLPGQAPARALTVKTWSNSLPVAKTITVNSGAGTFNVAEGGTPSGYVVYQGAPGAVLDAGNVAQYNVTINASYVILRGLTLKGAKQDAIRISPAMTDVVIEDNDISGWGRTRDGKWGADMDSAVRAVCSQPTMQRVTIQRNRMHDPRYGANSWSDGHPAGPQAITFSYCGGNHVIRHNDMYSNNGNYFNDVIGGEDNFTKGGFPNADTDIYANKLANSWDDGIEAEGANENVRIWGNYIDRTAIGIATTVASVGPVYIFRNVQNRTNFREAFLNNPDADDHAVFLKSGSDSSLGNGRRYVFHNTMLQATQAGAVYTLGAGAAIGGSGSTQLINNTVSKNNIFHVWKNKGVAYQFGSGNEFANDMYSGGPGEAQYTGGIVGTPVYAAGNGPANEGQYQLATNSPGYGRGVRIANFNDAAATPDVGAHQSASGGMGFGVAASPGPAVSGGSNLPPSATPPPSPTPAPAPAPSPTSGAVSLSSSGLQFGNVQGSQAVTFTNTSSSNVTFIQAAMSSGKYSQGNNCGDVSPGASCTATVTFFPGNSGTNSGTFIMTSSAANSPHVVSLAGMGEPLPASAARGRLGNLSSRMHVLNGNDVVIGGFVIGGFVSKTVVIRARGPSLIPFGITNALANPTLQLVRSSDQATLASNDNWGSAVNAAAITASGLAPSNPFESAILVTLDPGAYTTIVSGVAGGTGVGMVEVFEVDRPEAPLSNISARGQVLTGNDVMIGGFVVQGSGPQTVVVRARGPSLVGFGIPNALANPTLTLVRSSDQAPIASNDDWQSAPNASAISASGFAPSHAREAAIMVTLEPGAYTAIVTGVGGGTGVGIVEVFVP